MSFLPHVMSHGPWSVSKLGVIEKCSLQFFYKYGEKRPEVLPSSPESRIGTAVHSALELSLQGTDLTRALRMAGKTHELTSMELEELDARSEQIKDFVKRVGQFKEKHGVRSTHIEEKWGLTADFKSTGFFSKDVFFRGVVDLAMIPSNGDLVIIDHKSGKERGLEYYAPQLKVYAIMGLAKYPNARNVKLGLNFITTNNMVWDSLTPAEVVRSQYQPWLVDYMNETCKGLTEAPAPKPSRLCDWCGYKPICPAFAEVSGATNESKQD
jgi:putative RecB family exonuclease